MSTAHVSGSGRSEQEQTLSAIKLCFTGISLFPNIPGGSPSRGNDVMSNNKTKIGEGGRRKF